MFITSEEYVEHVRALIKGDGDLSIAVAFWGEGAGALFDGVVRRQVRIICNLESGATNPDEIDALRNRIGFQVRTNRRLHAKVFLGAKTAIVGSANASSNGLNLEDYEASGWEEAGIETSDAATLSSMRDWFESMWAHSGAVHQKDIDDARTYWKVRRGTRGFHETVRSDSGPVQWMMENWRSFKDRSIMVVIYRIQETTSEAKAVEKNWKDAMGDVHAGSRLGHYENWDSLPKTADLIDVYYGLRSAVRANGIWRWIGSVAKSSGGDIQIARSVDTLESLSDIVGAPKIRARDVNKFIDQWVKPNMAKVWDACSQPPNGEDGRKISLYDVMKLLFEG